MSSATDGSMRIRTSPCPPGAGDGRHRSRWDPTSGCGRGSEHISASLLVNDCSTLAAASGRQRSRSPRISAKAGGRRRRRVREHAARRPFQRPSRTLSRALHPRRCVLPRRARRFLRRRAVRTHAPVARRPRSRGRRDGSGGAPRRPRVADRHRLVHVDDRCRRRRTRQTGPRRDADGAQSPVQCRPATARPRRRGWLRSARENRGDADLDDVGPRLSPARLVASRWRDWPTTSSLAPGWRPPMPVSCRDPRRRARGRVLDAPDDVAVVAAARGLSALPASRPSGDAEFRRPIAPRPGTSSQTRAWVVRTGRPHAVDGREPGHHGHAGSGVGGHVPDAWIMGRPGVDEDGSRPVGLGFAADPQPGNGVITTQARSSSPVGGRSRHWRSQSRGIDPMSARLPTRGCCTASLANVAVRMATTSPAFSSRRPARRRT